MLLKLVGHHPQNSLHIDKLIVIHGLPEDWVFRKRSDGGRELNPPFTPDIDVNIPPQIRHLCTPTEIVVYYPPIERGVPGITDKRTILGVKLDYMTEPGREMWVRIERYIEGILPRDEKLPIPVMCAKDQKSPFETYVARRRVSGGVELEPAEIPVVDLDRYAKPVPVLVVPPKPEPVMAPEPQAVAASFKCAHCDYVAPKPQAVRMHTLKRHLKPKVGAAK